MANQTPIIVQKSGPDPIILIGGAAAAIFLYLKVLKPYLDKIQAKADLSKDQATDIKAGSTKGKLIDLNGRAITNVNLSTIATDVYNGLHPGFFVPTKQDRVVRAFKNTPFGYVKQLEQIYLNKYGENLKETMADKLSDVNFIKVKTFFSY